MSLNAFFRQNICGLELFEKILMLEENKIELMKELLLKKNKATFSIKDLKTFKRQAFAWSAREEVVCYLDSNDYREDKYASVEGLLAVGKASELLPSGKDSFGQLKDYYEEKKDWLFGFLTYDLKNEIEDLTSKNLDGVELPALHFFQPKIVIEFQNDAVTIHTKEESAFDIFEKILNTDSFDEENFFNGKKIKKEDIKSRISKEKYLETIASIREHIMKGDIYEMNFCQEFYIEDLDLNPYVLFEKFNEVGQAPFSAFYKLKDKFLLCASPERFMTKKETKLISQPIKGTIRRGTTYFEDQTLKYRLYTSEKDRSENVMIVDLVRNDLARSCKAGSVHVEELFGIYPFEQVHQMISTVVGELEEEVHFVDAIKNAYPMGSMTGAPKIRSMQLIEKYEATKRGLYSGAVGYITPEGNFDFNVVIRSMIYNQPEKYLSYQTGGAIVFDSKPESEYEECLLKAKGMMQTLGL